MTEAEARELVSWAADEGWNPGRDDARIFWATDPEGFVAAELDGQLVGGGVIAAYGTSYGFMGLFIMRPEYRGRGLGAALWHARRDLLRARLDPGAPIGMDGVVAMEPFYARGGFVRSHQNRRYRFDAPDGAAAPAAVDAQAVPFAQLAAYDGQYFPGPRDAFLRDWIDQEQARARVLVEDGQVTGFGVRRACGEGHKVGPLFAEDPASAVLLLDDLASGVRGEPCLLDIPDTNPHREALLGRYAMEEVFSCARMYLGEAPAVDESRVYGITTFELG